MEYVVLGLLMENDQTIYELFKNFQKGISLFYSASYGALQAAIGRLQGNGWIQFDWLKVNNRPQKRYQINQLGQEAFFMWMAEGEIPASRAESAILSKLYFLGQIESPEMRIKILKNIVQSIKETLQNLCQLDRELQQIAIPEPARTAFFFQTKTLNYGIEGQRFAIEWFEKLIAETGQKKTKSKDRSNS